MTELDREQVTRKVQSILVEVLNLEAPPGPDERLVEDLGAESVDVLSLLFELEEAFGRSIPDDQIPTLTTVSAIADRILGAQPEPGSTT
jgi:acyl carrier protein